MRTWVALAYGALDLVDWHENESSTEVMLLSTLPSEPIGLAGAPAALWKRLVDGPVSDGDLTEEERALVREFADAGIASTDVDHPSRQRRIPKPWLSSPVHELLYAMITRLTQANGVRVVFIKGPVLHLQGLRNREHSGDIDVWIDPKRIADVADLLEEWGWELLPGFWGDMPAYHSMTMLPTWWGCEIDLHRHMPGCGAPDNVSFAALLEDSNEVSFAGVDAHVPSRNANAVLSALHFTRPHPYPNPPETVTRAVDILQRVGEDALEFAEAVQATAALEPVIRQAFPDVTLPKKLKLPYNWRWRAESNPFKRAVLASRALGPAEWPRFLGKLVWPEEKVAMRFDRKHGGRSKTVLGARLRRLQYGVLATFSRKRRADGPQPG